MIGRMPFFAKDVQAPAHYGGRRQTQPTYVKSTPFSILVKNKYFKMMQTRATLAL